MTTPVNPGHGGQADDTKETGRIEAFSDGLFAIAITLLVLDLHVPLVGSTTGDTLLPLLLKQWPAYIAFLLSFVTILIMWVNHHALFHYIHHTDHIFLMLNGLLLLGITVVPFPTAILAQYIGRPDQHVAAVVYSATYAIIALTFNLVWWYAAHNNRLLHPHQDVRKMAELTRSYQLGPLFMAAPSYWPSSALRPASRSACSSPPILLRRTNGTSRKAPSRGQGMTCTAVPVGAQS
ncbi:MAG: TMEM175 family protein [Chloroflexota bacterium]